MMDELSELKCRLSFNLFCTLRLLALLVIYPLWFWLLWNELTWLV
jgi:hypothetical protein